MSSELSWWKLHTLRCCDERKKFISSFGEETKPVEGSRELQVDWEIFHSLELNLLLFSIAFCIITLDTMKLRVEGNYRSGFSRSSGLILIKFASLTQFRSSRQLFSNKYSIWFHFLVVWIMQIGFWKWQRAREDQKFAGEERKKSGRAAEGPVALAQKSWILNFN